MIKNIYYKLKRFLKYDLVPLEECQLLRMDEEDLISIDVHYYLLGRRAAFPSRIE